MDFAKLMEEARQTNLERDQSEKSSGFKPNSECSVFDQLKTIFFALKAGIKTDDWNCIAEAAAMVESILDKYVIILQKGN